ncbi:MAG TPA: hypothetical protein VF145_02455 [Chitinophagaceae bacterium]
MKALATCLFSALVPFLAMAHEGHGETGGYTIIHYFTEPIHMFATAALIAFAAFGFFRWLRKEKNKDA